MRTIRIPPTARIVQVLAASTSLTFRLYKQRYYRRYEVDRSLSDDALVAQLHREGFAVVPAFVEPEMATTMIEEVRQHLDAVRGRLPDVRGHQLDDYGVTRALGIDERAPSTAAFFASPRIAEVARRYVGADVVAYQKMAERRDVPAAISSADIVHFDDWRSRFKAFLYLTEVGRENAPFVYFPGTHLPALWRNHKEREYARRGPRGSYGHFLPHELEAILTQQPFERCVVTGGPGTLILADTRGLHSGTPIAVGERILLASYFDVR